MAVDPNWIFSTAAQSAAALVGIVGAFLVSALLSIGSDHARARSRLRDVNDRVAHLSARREELWDELDDLEARAFLSRTTDEIIRHQGNIDLAPLRRIGGSQPEDAVLVPRFEAFKQEVRNAVAYFRKNRSRREARPPESMEEFLFQHALDLSEDADVDAYRHVYEALRRAWKPPEPSPSSGFGLAIPRFDLPYMSTYYPPPIFHATGERERKTLEAEKLGAEIDTLAVDQRALESDLRAGGDLSHIWTGFGILAYFAVVGILVPLALMPVEPEALTPATRWLNFGLFTSGLTALLVYIAFLIARIKRSIETSGPTRPPPPSQ